MWLIDTSELTLKYYPRPPKHYAILSHTWNGEEVSFQEFQRLEATGHNVNEDATQHLRNRSGYAKIRKYCDLARSEGLLFAWIDTCCIDKTSSAELSESINSMFAWYRGSTVCYAYLEDVDSTSSTRKSNGEPSRWYSRGWTLQELVAPREVHFYNANWCKIGTKSSLSEEISALTGISEPDINEFEPGPDRIDEKMSWAAKRETTREEDMAYCLLGLFGIHMPLIYGEGRKAFRRLREELFKVSADQTNFPLTHPAWQLSLPMGTLAALPQSFEGGGELRRITEGTNMPPPWYHRELADAGTSGAVPGSLGNRWLDPQRPQTLPRSEYVARVFLDSFLVLAGSQLLSPSDVTEIVQEDGGLSLALADDTAAVVNLVFGRQKYAVCFGVLSVNQSRGPLTVCCSITNTYFKGSLDRCKRLLDQYGKARGSRDGIWTNYLVPTEGEIIVWAYNESGSGRGQRDLVYIGWKRNHIINNSLAPVSAPNLPGLHQSRSLTVASLSDSEEKSQSEKQKAQIEAIIGVKCSRVLAKRLQNKLDKVRKGR